MEDVSHKSTEVSCSDLQIGISRTVCTGVSFTSSTGTHMFIYVHLRFSVSGENFVFIIKNASEDGWECLLREGCDTVSHHSWIMVRSPAHGSEISVVCCVLCTRAEVFCRFLVVDRTGVAVQMLLLAALHVVFF